ncbi:MAG: cytochrome c biogenesis protein CcsA, partial [Selenomonadaceae bacterium]|nr:cytochrome c biogenesis protein CcsA [Selenomonadaceae bacterium]
RLGFIFVLLSTISGAIFSKLTWGAYWNWDPRQTTIFVLILIYGAYLTLRAAVSDEKVRAKVSAVYSLLSVLTVPFLVFIIPRMYFSLHPSPVLNSAGKIEMDSIVLIVLIAAVVDATLIFVQLMRRELS